MKKRERERETRSRCYATGDTDIPQFFKVKLTDNSDGKERVKVTCTLSPRCLVFSSSRFRPICNHNESFRDSWKKYSPFRGWRKPYLPFAPSATAASSSRSVLAVNAPHVYERAIAFFRIHYHLFYRTTHARRLDPILSCSVGRILQYGLARRGALLPITKPNLERYTRPDMSAHVFTWSIDSLAVYIRGSYKLGGMLLFSDAGQRRRSIVAHGNTLSPRRYGPPSNRLQEYITIFSSRESDRLNRFSARTLLQYHPMKKLRSEKTLWCTFLYVPKIDNNCILLFILIDFVLQNEKFNLKNES